MIIQDLFDDLKKVPFKTHAFICSFSFLIWLAGYLYAQQFEVLGYPRIASICYLVPPFLVGLVMSLMYIRTFMAIEYKDYEIERLQTLSSKEYWNATMQDLLSCNLQIMSGDKNITEQYLASRFEEERQKNVAELAKLTGENNGN